MKRTIAAIGLGSNLGDRERNLAAGLRRLDRAPGVVLLRRSRWIETQAVGGPPGQPPYLNGAALLESELDASSLLELMQAVEARYGREAERAAGPKAPRTLDLDLLWFGDQCCDTPKLRLPHPRLEQRLFVLEPLAELCPDKPLPSGRSVQSCLDELRATMA